MAVIQGKSQEVLKHIKTESIDMVLTSPPYDNLRSYHNCTWNFDIFKEIAKELSRVIKKGGVIVWIVSDATIQGSESGSSFKQALYFKELGLRLHDTMIWNKLNSTYASGIHSVRYTNVFEYMFILSKGRPKTINLIKDKINKTAGKSLIYNTTRMRQIDGKDVRDTLYKKIKITDKFGIRFNIWDICQARGNKIAHKHPAIFPEKLAEDHIITWSNKGDIVLDCFAGSGTNLKMAKKLGRRYVGIELNKEYIDIINKRLKS